MTTITGISVIVPAYNEEQYIKLCLEELLKQSASVDFDVEIIVVDNDSTDNTKGIASEYPVTLSYSKSKSAAGVRNEGAKQAKFSVLAFIDADCVASKDWLNRIYSKHKQADIGAYGGPHIAPKDQNWIVSTWHPRELKHKYASKGKLPGSNFSIKKDIFWEVGGFDEHLISAEDDILSLKVMQKYSSVKDSVHFVEHYGYPDNLTKIVKQQIWHGSTQLKAHGLFGDKVTLVSLLWLIAFILAVVSFALALKFLFMLFLILIFFIPVIFILNKLKAARSISFITLFKAYPIAFAYTLGRAIGIVKELKGIFI